MGSLVSRSAPSAITRSTSEVRSAVRRSRWSRFFPLLTSGTRCRRTSTPWPSEGASADTARRGYHGGCTRTRWTRTALRGPGHHSRSRQPGDRAGRTADYGPLLHPGSRWDEAELAQRDPSAIAADGALAGMLSGGAVAKAGESASSWACRCSGRMPSRSASVTAAVASAAASSRSPGRVRRARTRASWWVAWATAGGIPPRCPLAIAARRCRTASSRRPTVAAAMPNGYRTEPRITMTPAPLHTNRSA